MTTTMLPWVPSSRSVLRGSSSSTSSQQQTTKCTAVEVHIIYPHPQNSHMSEVCHWPSPRLYSIFTHDCSAIHPTNTFIIFADYFTIVVLISNNNKTAYREEVQHLTNWCLQNNRDLNISKTKEIILVRRFKFLDVPELSQPHLDCTNLTPGKEIPTKTVFVPSPAPSTC